MSSHKFDLKLAHFHSVKQNWLFCLQLYQVSQKGIHPPLCCVTSFTNVSNLSTKAIELKHMLVRTKNPILEIKDNSDLFRGKNHV